MKWITLSTLLVLAACGSEPNGRTTAEAADTPDPTAAVADRGTAGLTALNMDQWARNCALCHVRGEGGAPVLGDAAAWAPRLAQGEDLLLKHTVEGLNNMPPLGYCMDCEADDFQALIRFMGGLQ